MTRLVQLRRFCDQGMDCPTLHYQPDSDEFLIQGYIVTDPEVLARLSLPAGQTVVRVSASLLPELEPDPDSGELFVQGYEVTDVALLKELNLPVGEAVVRVSSPPVATSAERAPTMLTLAELSKIASLARSSLFRLETLDCYEGALDGSELSVYLASGDQPRNPKKLAWQEHLRAERAAGIWRHRVHLIDTTNGLNGYLRYECEWGYTATTAAGEGVRILDLPVDRRPPALIEIDHDFWLFDEEQVVRMYYNADGTFHGAEQLPAHHTSRYQAARDVAWDMAEEFTSWWAAHPEYHRANQHVT